MYPNGAPKMAEHNRGDWIGAFSRMIPAERTRIANYFSLNYIPSNAADLFNSIERYVKARRHNEYLGDLLVRSFNDLNMHEKIPQFPFGEKYLQEPYSSQKSSLSDQVSSPTASVLSMPTTSVPPSLPAVLPTRTVPISPTVLPSDLKQTTETTSKQIVPSMPGEPTHTQVKWNWTKSSSFETFDLELGLHVLHMLRSFTTNNIVLKLVNFGQPASAIFNGYSYVIQLPFDLNEDTDLKITLTSRNNINFSKLVELLLALKRKMANVQFEVHQSS